MEKITQESYHEATITDKNGSPMTLRAPVVQELARLGIQDVPKMFQRQSITNTKSCSPDDFPSVSMARLRSMNLEERTQELEKLARGASEWGILLVSDHGIPSSLLGEVKGVVKGFFGLSIEEKRKSIGTNASIDNMGYGRSYVKKNQSLDWVDRVTVMAAPKGATDGLDHVWPKNPHNFRDIMEQYADEARNVGDQLFQALAEALSIEKDTFLRYFDKDTSLIKVRVNYYPPCPDPNSTVGLSPHADPSALSLLIQIDSSGGLQVMKKGETVWQTIPFPEDAFAVIVGNFLEIMSNGRVTSAWHRAVTQPDVERMSVALFYGPGPKTLIEPATAKKDQSDDDVYRKLTVEEYQQHFNRVSPAIDKQATLNFAKISPSP